jgi:hypothetical protein
MVSDAIDWFTDDVLGFDPPAGGNVSPQQIAQQQTKYSFVNQDTPFGSVSYDLSGDNVSQQYSESPFMQFLRQGQEDITGNVLGYAQSQIGNLPVSPMNMDGARGYGDTFAAGQGMNMDPTDYGQATFDYMNTLAQPGFEQQDLRFNQGIVNQGIDPTSELGRRMSTQYGDQRQRDLQQMRNAALQQSLGAQGQMFDQSVREGAFDNATRRQQFGEQQGLRNQQLSEIGSLLGMQQIPYQSPGFFAPGTVNVPGAYNTSLAAQQANQTAQNDILGAIPGAVGGLADLGGWIWDLF